MTMDNSKKKENLDEEKDKIEIDFKKGKISFEGIFKGLGSLLDMVDKFDVVEKKGSIESPEGIRGIYGFTVKNLAGKPIVETFGNKKISNLENNQQEVREPITDIFNEKDRMVIVLEMPGVNEEDIMIEIKDETIVIQAESKSRKYFKEIKTGFDVSQSTFLHSYLNGIFKIEISPENGKKQ